MSRPLPKLAKTTAKPKPPGKKLVRENLIQVAPVRAQSLSSIVTLVKRKFAHLAPTPMPADIKPMLATLADAPFDRKDWIFEIKWDGYRALSYLQNGEVALRSRNNLSFDKKFAPVHEALQGWKINAVVDGEIVVLDEEGKADFGGLQNWVRTREGNLYYYVYDLLWLDGLSLMGETLTARKEALRRLVPEGGVIRYSDGIEESGKSFFEMAERSGLEGIMGKDANAPYLPGYRTENWLKIKSEERHEALICGYTKKPGTAKLFSSLILGLPQGKGYKFIGHVGTGFDARMQRELFRKMNPHFVANMPFAEMPPVNAPTQWVAPKLVCEVKYTELTADGVMRHASFQGLREDKSSKDLNIG